MANSKLDPATVIQIRSAYLRGKKLKQIQKALRKKTQIDVKRDALYRVIHYRTWKEVPIILSYQTNPTTLFPRLKWFMKGGIQGISYGESKNSVRKLKRIRRIHQIIQFGLREQTSFLTKQEERLQTRSAAVIAWTTYAIKSYDDYGGKPALLFAPEKKGSKTLRLKKKPETKIEPKPLHQRLQSYRRTKGEPHGA